MDINLGKKSDYNGYEAARRIKAVKPHLIIVSFSSASIEERAELGPEMDGHIKKDFSKRNLQENLVPFLLKPKNKKRKVCSKKDLSENIGATNIKP